MKPAPFVYHAPDSLPEVISLLSEVGDDAKLLAGGQSLVPVMNMRLSRPAELIDICRVSELAGIAANGGLTIQAATRQAAVQRSAEVTGATPILQAALEHVGHPANRTRGTFGGSLAHADPAAELPTTVVALDGRMVIAGPRGERTVGAEDFFKGYYTTAIEPDEVLTRVELPPLPVGRQQAWSFLELARRHGDFAIAGVAFVATVSEDGSVESARIAMLGVADVPVRAVEAEQSLVGRHLDDEDAVSAAARLAVDHIEPPSDAQVSSQYRIDVTSVLVTRTIRQSATRLVG